MKLKKETVDEFKKIYKEEYAEELSDEEAQDKAKQVLMLFKGTYKHIELEASSNKG